MSEEESKKIQAAKDLLNTVRTKKLRIKSIDTMRAEIAACKADIIKAAFYNPQDSKTQSIIRHAEELDRELDKQKTEYNEQINMIASIVALLPNQEDAYIITEHYFKFRKVSKIADEIYMSITNAYIRIDKACIRLYDIISGDESLKDYIKNICKCI